MPDVRRGEIWWANLPEPVGSEPGYRRPVVVVQANAYNRSEIRTVLVAIITGNVRLANAPGNVLLSPEASGLPKTSVVNVSQVATVNLTHLSECVGVLPKHVMNAVDNGLQLALEL